MENFRRRFPLFRFSTFPRFSSIHPRSHFAHGFFYARKKRAADDTVTTVEFVKMGDRSQFGDVHVIDAMPGVHDQPKFMSANRADPQSLKPGTHMPATALTADDLSALVAYLSSLK